MKALKFKGEPFERETKAEHLQRVKEVSRKYWERQNKLVEGAERLAALINELAAEYTMLGEAADELAEKLYVASLKEL